MRVMKSFAPISIAVLGVVLGVVPGGDIDCPCTTAAAADASSSAEVQVIVVRATQAWFAAEIRVTGFLVARTEAIVTLDNPGFKITEVLAGEGDRVSSGQVLVRMVRPATEAAGPGAPATPATTGTLKAPVTGVITRSTAAVGATASPAQTEPLYRIAVDNEIELEAEVPSIHVPILAPGQTARVEIENNRELSGTVRLAPALVDARTQLGHARVSMERDPQLRLGMFARATIEANRSRGISVPRSAVFYRTEGPSVQIVRDGIIETRRVRVGYQSDTDTEIREGLSEGDLVVANAGSSLRDGDKVKPVPADDTRMGLR
jgi:multidrug efflux pump subunit AcrA (membrane-fusion protein)